MNAALARAAMPELPAMPSLSLPSEEEAEARLREGVQHILDSTHGLAETLRGAPEAWGALGAWVRDTSSSLSSGVHLPEAGAAAELLHLPPDLLLEGERLLHLAASQPLPSAPLLAALLSSLALLSVASGSGQEGSISEVDELPFLAYDPPAAAAYFRLRPLQLLSRGLVVARLLGGWGLNLALDRASGREEEQRPLRAAHLRGVLTSLGPAAVKLGQVLSARVDLLPAAYLSELRLLQDAVPPFPEKQARAILAADLAGGDGAFLSLSELPLASASLGQVYRGVTRDGRSVAVKVQRPRVARGIARDLLLLRWAAPLVQSARGLNTDLVGLIDEWGVRFVDELDYRKEAASGSAFRAAMAARGLGDTVTAAEVLPSLSSRRVLTTQWIEGGRIDDAGAVSAEERQRLVGVALAAYLTMLLDTGCLHADPHPGNLLRSPSGQLVVLDWGLTTPVSAPQQAAILSYIAHLVGRDFSAVPADLLAMGFVPPSKAQALADSGVASVLAEVFRALAKGGGAKAVSKELREGGKVEALARDVAAVQSKYGNILQIPTYFAYILRCFSVLEGVGLAAAPGFSIAQSCYPYVAQRLLSDRSPQAEAALESILYGPAGKEGHLDPRRVRQLALAFRAYSTTTSAPAHAADAASPPSSALGPGAREALRLALQPQGGPLQTVLLREVARSVGSWAAVSAARGVAGFGPLSELWVRSQTAAAASAASPGPPGMAQQLFALGAAAVRRAPGDDERVAAASELLGEFLAKDEAPGAPAVDGGEQARAWAAAAAPLLPELVPGIGAAALRFGAVLLFETAERVARAQATAR